MLEWDGALDALPATRPQPPPAGASPGKRRRSSPLAAGRFEVSVCIANWNCREHLRACLDSLLNRPQGVPAEVVVVDNGSKDGAADMVAERFPAVRLIRNTRNLGFARANNQAADAAGGRYLLFLNNDTVVPPDSLRRMVEFADRTPGVGMIGPRLRGGGGEVQISYRCRPSVRAMLHRTALFRWTGRFRAAYRHYRRSTFRPEANRPVEVLMGAAVMLPREVFHGCGGWDEDFHFGGEDIDLSRRVGRRHGLYFLADVEITHFGRVSSRENIGFAAPNVLIGYVHYFRKSGTGRAGVLMYKLVVTADAPLQMAGKLIQYACRRLRGRPEKASRSLLAFRGIWRFARHDLARFWRA